MFTAEFYTALVGDGLASAFPVIHELMQRNSPGLGGHGIPVLILQGTDDIVIDKTSQDAFVLALRASGSAVRYAVYQGSRHDTRQASFPLVLDWMREMPVASRQLPVTPRGSVGAAVARSPSAASGSLAVLWMIAAAAAHALGPGQILDVQERQLFSPEQIRREARLLFEGFDDPAPELAVATYDLRFRSTDADGSPATVYAQLFVPLAASEPADFPVLVFGSGTTGIGDQCAPSREQPDVVRWGYYRSHMLAYASRGFITIFPDYLGFNDATRPQRYFSKLAEGQTMLDAARAVYRFFDSYPGDSRPARQVFTNGYSQGGHAAFAAADLLAEYAPDVPLIGAIGFGTTNDVARLFREGPRYAPYIIYTYQQLYGETEIDPARYLRAEFAEGLADTVARMCVEAFQRYYPRDAASLFTPEFRRALFADDLAEHFPGIAARIDENNTGLSGHRIPGLIMQGEADTIARTRSQTAFVEALRGAGSAVRYIRMDGISHRHSRAAGFEPSIEWMRWVAGGGPPPND
jgi:dienelactone hydrolase